MKSSNLITTLLASATLLGGFRATSQDMASGQPPVSSEAASGEVPAVMLSYPAQELLKLAESGVGEDIQTAFINASTSPFSLTAGAILYMRDQGVSTDILTAMLNRDKTLAVQYPNTPPTSPVPTSEVPPPAVDQSTPQPEPEVAPTQAPQEVSYFYNDLAPYGTWINIDGYGTAWQPNAVVVDHNWRPYCNDGYWMDSSAGWYWHSQYSWGWAPFHYGRWQLHPRVGWVWFPDTTWGPGWVEWRNGSDACGWAPLPFGAECVPGVGFRFHGAFVDGAFDFGLGLNAFTFVALGDFASHDYVHRAMDRDRARMAFERTVVIHDHLINDQRIVVNRGVERARVEAAAHVTLRKFEIRDGQPGGARVGSVTPGVVFRRPLRAPEAPVNMFAQKVGEHTTSIHHESIVPRMPNLGRVSVPNGREAMPGQNNFGQPNTRPGSMQPQQQHFSQPNSSPSRGPFRQESTPHSFNNSAPQQPSNPPLARETHSDANMHKTVQPYAAPQNNAQQGSPHANVGASRQQSNVSPQAPVHPSGNAAMTFHRQPLVLPSGNSSGAAASAPVPTQHVLQSSQGAPLQTHTAPAVNTHVYEQKSAAQFVPTRPATSPAATQSRPQQSSGQNQSQGHGGNAANGTNNHP